MAEFKRLSELLNTFVSASNGPVGCACAVKLDGKQVFEGYAGYADIETKAPIAPDTLYRIFSMTKVITCAAALILYERGKFLLNDPLHLYMPDYKHMKVWHNHPNGKFFAQPAKRHITVKDLFTMTSGLTYYDGDSMTGLEIQKLLDDKKKDTYSNLQVLAKSLSGVTLAFEPGTSWYYGFSHDVLAALIEVVSGKRFSDFLREEIFEPLEMHDTFHRLPDEKKHRLCGYYIRKHDGSLTTSDFHDEHMRPYATFEGGGAGLVSSLWDYMRFAEMLTEGGSLNGKRILSQATVKLMATNHITDEMRTLMSDSKAGYGYGLGVRVLTDRVGGGSNSSDCEFGWSGMLGTYVIMDPATKLTAVYMQQLQPALISEQTNRLRNVIYSCI